MTKTQYTITLEHLYGPEVATDEWPAPVSATIHADTAETARSVIDAFLCGQGSTQEHSMSLNRIKMMRRRETSVITGDGSWNYTIYRNT